MPSDMLFPDVPPAVNPQRDIYKPLPKTAHLVDWKAVNAVKVATQTLGQLAAALSQDEANHVVLEDLFRNEGSYWRDTLALTAHIRTFSGLDVIARMLKGLGVARGVSGFTLTKRTSCVISVSPETSWVDCSFTFRTAQPHARCQGKLMLVPWSGHDGTVQWKIWSMATLLTEFEEYPEDPGLLTTPSQPISEGDLLWTDVLVVGAGNAGLIQAARLKAMNIDYMLVEKNEQAGDNWAKRYDYLRFHIGKNYCQVPYLPYSKKTNYLLTRDDLRDQMRRFAEEFDLNKRVLYRTTILKTEYDEASQFWNITVVTDGLKGARLIQCKTMVLATGSGFNVPYFPEVRFARTDLFTGPKVHAHHFRSGAELKAQGIKSVIIVGSANSAFDILEDCHNAGLKVTMVQRSPTLVIPMAYYEDPRGMGIFDYISTAMADTRFMTGPLQVGGELSRMGHAANARAEPDRYKAAIEAGFRVKDCTQDDLLGHLSTTAGGFLVDMGTGGMDLIASGVVKVVAGSPVAYTSSGLELDSGKRLDADAIVWCTGYKTDIREELPGILGLHWERIAVKLEATLGVDCEGELRGLFKRFKRQDNLWVLGGGTAQHRWYSRIIAMQVQGVLEGILPDACRD